jgi:hypothetical protein
MTEHPDALRHFSVRARHLDSHHSRLVEEASFEAAAVAYVENLLEVAAEDDRSVVSVVVREVESGHEHCYLMDLDSGETTTCG